MTDWNEKARELYLNHCFYGSTEPEFIQAIATALAAVDDAAYERGRMEEREQNARILADPCVQKLRPDEPFFVLLGRDPDAKRALGEWLSSRENREGLSDKTHAAETTLFAFIDYQRKQP